MRFVSLLLFFFASFNFIKYAWLQVISMKRQSFEIDKWLPIVPFNNEEFADVNEGPSEFCPIIRHSSSVSRIISKHIENIDKNRIEFPLIANAYEITVLDACKWHWANFLIFGYKFRQQTNNNSKQLSKLPIYQSIHKLPKRRQPENEWKGKKT